MTFTNEAAWQTAPDSKTFEIGPGPTPNPSEDEVVIKVAYAAVNPVDWKASIPTPIPIPIQALTNPAPRIPIRPTLPIHLRHRHRRNNRPTRIQRHSIPARTAGDRVRPNKPIDTPSYLLPHLYLKPHPSPHNTNNPKPQPLRRPPNPKTPKQRIPTLRHNPRDPRLRNPRQNPSIQRRRPPPLRLNSRRSPIPLPSSPLPNPNPDPSKQKDSNLGRELIRWKFRDSTCARRGTGGSYNCLSGEFRIRAESRCYGI